jgi:D-alanyl-D-alanine carboxypeptidase
MQPVKIAKPKYILLPRLVVAVILLLLIVGVIAWNEHKTSEPQKHPVASFNKSQNSLNDPNSIWVIVNKGRVLPANFAPSDLTAPNIPLRLDRNSPEMQIRQVAASALEQMVAASNTQNVHLMLASGYRSYSDQVNLRNGYIKTEGQSGADTSSARPGHSEHQTALAADLEPTNRTCEVEECFATTPEGQWLAANAYKFGFIIRYNKSQEKLTGYEYEPWHVRYVGTDLAMQIHQSGQTLEQFFELPVYTNYPATSYQLMVGK